MKKIILGLAIILMSLQGMMAQTQSAKIVISSKDTTMSPIEGIYLNGKFTAFFEDTRSYTQFTMTENGGENPKRSIKQGAGKIVINFQNQNGYWEFDGQESMSFTLERKRGKKWKGQITDLTYEESADIELRLVLL